MPQSVAGSKRKRRRKVLSCYDCRRKKMQCDRQSPACGRCIQVGRADTCLYIDEDHAASHKRPGDGFQWPANSESEGESEAIPDQSNRDLLFRLEDRDQRIKQLEADLTRAGQLQPTDSVKYGEHSARPLLIRRSGNGDTSSRPMVAEPDHASTSLQDQSLSTSYHGRSAVVGDFASISPKLDQFARAIYESFPALERIQRNARILEGKSDQSRRRVRPATGTDLKALLPPKPQVDDGVRLYLANYGGIYHVFHLPTFWTQYSEMWADMDSCRAHFVAVVLLMVSASSCLNTAQSGGFAVDYAKTCIQACEVWLRTQNRKNTTATDFQVRFLLMLAKLTTLPKFKTASTEASDLLRFCMDAGLHRDPDLVGAPTSTLDKELRRRIWHAVAELELQRSLDRGMPPTPWPLLADCRPPSNILDEDIAQSATNLPPVKPRTEHTNSAYLAMAARSVALRHTLATALNDIRHPLSFDEAKRFTEEISSHLGALPQWNDTGAEIPQALMRLNLLQYLLIIHNRQARQAASTIERYFSRVVLFETAMKIITTHKTLFDNGHFALASLCNDHLRAGLCLCQVAISTAETSSSMINQIIEPHVSSLVEDAITMITDKLIRFGRERRYLFILLVANGVCKANRNPYRRKEYIEEVVDRMVTACYRMMSSSEDTPLAELNGTVAEQGQSLEACDGSYIPQIAESRHGEGFGNLALLGDETFDAWMYEDSLFGPDDLLPGLPQS